MTTNISPSTRTSATGKRGPAAKRRTRQPGAGVSRLVRRLDRERRAWARRPEREEGVPVVPTEVAWRAGVAEGLRLAQLAIRRGV